MKMFANWFGPGRTAGRGCHAGWCGDDLVDTPTPALAGWHRGTAARWHRRRIAAVLDGVSTAISAGIAVLFPAGANRNIVNSGNVPLKLYTLYAPPNDRDGVVNPTRADAEADSEHFDGRTSE